MYLDSVHTHTGIICIFPKKTMWQNGKVQVGGEGVKPSELLW